MMDKQIEETIDAEVAGILDTLRDIRSMAQISTREVQERSGVSRDTVSRFERGQADLKTVREVLRIFAACTGQVPQIAEAVKAAATPPAPERPEPAPP